MYWQNLTKYWEYNHNSLKQSFLFLLMVLLLILSENTVAGHLYESWESILEKNGHFFSPYSYRRLCQFAIIRTNEPTRGLVNTLSCAG